MRKRNILLVMLSVVFALLIGGGIYKATRPSQTPVYYAKAKSAPTVAKCLAENSSLTIPGPERNTIEMAALSYLIDVPAGTNVDIKIATYSNDKVTGSDRYPTKYGNYNFVMVKRSGNWAFTDFKHCN